MKTANLDVCSYPISLKKSASGRLAPKCGADGVVDRRFWPGSHAGFGLGIGISFASLRRFWAVAARRNSSRAPHGPRSRRRSRRRMRLRWANSISTFLRSRRETRHRPRSWRCRGPCRGRLRGWSAGPCGPASLGQQRGLRAQASQSCLAGAIEQRRAVVHHACPWWSGSCRRDRSRRRQSVVGEVLAGERAIVARSDLSNTVTVRLDAAVMDQPAEHLGRSIGAVAQPAAPGRGRSAPRRVRSCVLAAVTSAWRIAVVGFDIDDDRMVEIDQVVGRSRQRRPVRHGRRSSVPPDQPAR